MDEINVEGLVELDAWLKANLPDGPSWDGYMEGAKDRNAELIRALKPLVEAIKMNHEWHQKHDEYEGYQDSDIEQVNESAIHLASIYGIV